MDLIIAYIRHLYSAIKQHFPLGNNSNFDSEREAHTPTGFEREERGWGAAISGGGRRRQRSGGVRLTETIDQNMTAPNYIKC